MDNVSYRNAESIASNDLSPESKRRLILDLVESLKGNELVEFSKDITVQVSLLKFVQVSNTERNISILNTVSCLKTFVNLKEFIIKSIPS